MNLVLIGPPGSGKGTQAEMICSHYGIPRISAGDLLRLEVAEKSALGKEAKPFMEKGLLVPNELVSAVIRKRLDDDECKNGFLIDGFPRNVDQAVELESAKKIDLVLYLHLEMEEALVRLEGRRTCGNCGAVFHTKFNPPREDELCDKCGKQLVQRSDDKRDTIINRFKTFEKETLPLYKYYDEGGILQRIDASGSIEETHEKVRGILDSRSRP
jgi:adenylate kinase